MTSRRGEAINHARPARHLTRRRLADQVMTEDGTPISPPYLFAIEVHHRVPAPDVRRELTGMLEPDDETLLALTGAADVVVREDWQTHPEAEAAVRGLFRAAQLKGFEDWEHLCQRVERGRENRQRGLTHRMILP